MTPCPPATTANCLSSDLPGSACPANSDCPARVPLGSDQCDLHLIYPQTDVSKHRCTPMLICSHTDLSLNWYIFRCMHSQTGVSPHWCVPILVFSHSDTSSQLCVPMLMCPARHCSPHVLCVSFVPILIFFPYWCIPHWYVPNTDLFLHLHFLRQYVPKMICSHTGL